MHFIRLREAPRVGTVETTLRLTEEPFANPHRYDQLHGEEVRHVEA